MQKGVMCVCHEFGFKLMKTAYTTIKGFAVMRMIRRHCILIKPGVTGEEKCVSSTSSLISPPNPRCRARQFLAARR